MHYAKPVVLKRKCKIYRIVRRNYKQIEIQSSDEELKCTVNKCIYLIKFDFTVKPIQEKHIHDDRIITKNVAVSYDDHSNCLTAVLLPLAAS